MLTKPHCSPQEEEEEEGQGAGCGQHSLTESFEGCLHPLTPSQATMKILQLLLSWGEFGRSLVCWYICILTGCAGKQFCHRNMARVLSAGIHAVVLPVQAGAWISDWVPSVPAVTSMQMASAWHEEKAASGVFLPLARPHGGLLKAGVEICRVFVWQQFAHLYQEPPCVCADKVYPSVNLTLSQARLPFGPAAGLGDTATPRGKGSPHGLASSADLYL